MRALLSIVAIVLICLGVFSLAYFTSPVRIMMLDAMGKKLHLMVPMIGGAAILTGALILLVLRPTSSKDFK